MLMTIALRSVYLARVFLLSLSRLVSRLPWVLVEGVSRERDPRKMETYLLLKRENWRKISLLFPE